MAQAESEDEDFAVDSQEMEEANNSSSDSEGEDDQSTAVDVEEEDFTVQVKGGKIQKMKFENMQQVKLYISVPGYWGIITSALNLSSAPNITSAQSIRVRI